jgi:PAS domain S-box-containing protein
VRLRRHAADLLAANESLKQMAETALAGEARLREVASRLTKIFASSPVAIAMLAPADKTFLEVNERFCALTGYRSQQLLGRAGGELGLWRTAGGETVEALLGQGSRRDVEIELATAQGTRRAALASFDVLDLGAEDCLLVMLHDITARKELERIKDEFVAVVSHELRTPLTAIHGAIALLARQFAAPLAPDGQELLQIAMSNSERLSRLVNDILDIERIEAGKDELLLEPVEASELVAEVCRSLAGLAHAHGVELRTPPAVHAVVSGDRERLVQVLTNLVGNAIKFSPAAAAVDVTVERTAEGPVRFAVTDRGPGVRAELQARIFEKFERLSEGRARGGTGLGLAIAKAIVERHNGRIGLDSAPGRGATFWFVLGEGAQP